MDTTQRSSERGFALQKYLLLDSQHDALQRHISQIFASIHSNSAATASPSVSPSRSRLSSFCSEENTVSKSLPSCVRHQHRSSSTHRRPSMVKRNSSLPTVVDESILGEVKEEELKIRDVNLQIKSTLTELLNCDAVRNDGKARMWVQSRLMDAERELRGARRRRSD